jgi:hypothetical protein
VQNSISTRIGYFAGEGDPKELFASKEIRISDLIGMPPKPKPALKSTPWGLLVVYYFTITLLVVFNLFLLIFNKLVHYKVIDVML